MEEKNVTNEEVEQVVNEVVEDIEKLEAEEKNDQPEVNSVTEEKRDKGYFKYYLFILLNSILGFLFLLYFSKHLFEILAKKGIIDLRSLNMIPGIVLATIITMLFMLITIVFRKFFKKFLFSEIILYIYIGVLTTIINIIFWNFFFNIINGFMVNENIAWKVAEVIAFVIAVLFAFFADKIVVFKSYSFMPSKLFTELGSFVGARLITELINVGIMYYIIDYKKQQPFLGKVIASVIVIILNYLLSKFVIFRKKKIKNEEKN